jgi:hypothetical protein
VKTAAAPVHVATATDPDVRGPAESQAGLRSRH